MKIRLSALKGHPEAPLLALDLVVLFLISLNLLWLLLDAILLNTGSGVLFAKTFPEYFQHYKDHWHPNLLVYDTYFTIFLISELAVRWGIAIYRKTYHRWFFYPFVHWYDVLGCIPIPGFRLLRLLRLISIVYRLQQIGVINLSEGGIFKTASKYYQIILEEISDRIVINVLDGVKKEVQEMGPVSHQLVDRVLMPRRDIIVNWLGGQLSEVGRHSFEAKQDDLNAYLAEAVQKAFADNPDLRRLTRSIPIVGGKLENELRGIVTRLLSDITNQLLSDLGKPDNPAMQQLSASLFDTLTTPTASDNDASNRAIQGIALDVIELLKQQVSVQQWKIDELEERERQASQNNQ